MLYSQVTLKITGIPANTPAGSTIYFVGSANNWTLADANYILQPDGVGKYKIIIPQGTGIVKYKFIEEVGLQLKEMLLVPFCLIEVLLLPMHLKLLM